MGVGGFCGGNYEIKIDAQSYPSLFYGIDLAETPKKLPVAKNIIYTESKGVTVVFWEDGSKTLVRTCAGDTFDKERGFLQAYFEKAFGETKTQANKYLKSIVANASSEELRAETKRLKDEKKRANKAKLEVE